MSIQKCGYCPRQTRLEICTVEDCGAPTCPECRDEDGVCKSVSHTIAELTEAPKRKRRGSSTRRKAEAVEEPPPPDDEADAEEPSEAEEPEAEEPHE